MFGVQYLARNKKNEYFNSCTTSKCEESGHKIDNYILRPC